MNSDDMKLAKRLHGRQVLLGGAATLALAALISSAPVNFEKSLGGDVTLSLAHADGGEGGGDSDGGGDSGGGEGSDDHGGSSGGGEGSSGSDDHGESGSDDSGESGDDTPGDDDGTPDQGPGDVPVDPNAPAPAPAPVIPIVPQP